MSPPQAGRAADPHRPHPCEMANSVRGELVDWSMAKVEFDRQPAGLRSARLLNFAQPQKLVIPFGIVKNIITTTYVSTPDSCAKTSYPPYKGTWPIKYAFWIYLREGIYIASWQESSMRLYNGALDA